MATQEKKPTMKECTVVCKTKCSYGEKGEVVKMKLPDGELSDRQAVMLKHYEAPTVKGDDSKKELAAANKKIAELEKANADLTAKIAELEKQPAK